MATTPQEAPEAATSTAPQIELWTPVPRPWLDRERRLNSASNSNAISVDGNGGAMTRWMKEGPLAAPFDNVGEVRVMDHKPGRDNPEGLESGAVVVIDGGGQKN